MKRRGFLKLLAMTLGTAGVTARTIGEVFGAEVERGEEVDKWQCVKALRKLIERYKAAETQEERERTSLGALRIMGEAHRDVSAVWAGGCVTLWTHSLDSACLTILVRQARANRDDPIIGAMLNKFKLNCGIMQPLDTAAKIRSASFQIEADIAFHEMEGRTRAEALDWALKHHSGVLYNIRTLKRIAPERLGELYGVPHDRIK